jgi:hypothetical protein
MGSGLSSTVLALAVLPNGDLIAAGEFGATGGTTVNRIARWNGISWEPLGTGMNSGVAALAVLPNGDLIAGGSFTTAGGVAANRIARWDGTSWSPLGTGMNSNSSVLTLAVLPTGELIAGGGFATAGGVTVNNLARWDGTSWSPVGTGTSGAVFALASLPNGDLIVGGSFTAVGGVVALSVASITRQGLPDIIAQPPTQVPLAAMGTTIAVQVPPSSTYQFRWYKDGQPISDLSGVWSGATTATLQLLSPDPSLLGEYYVLLTNQCGTTRSSMTRVIEDAGQPCIGDYNQDGGVDGSDIESFFLDWAEGFTQADLNQDGGVDGADIETFFVAWEAGC